MSILDVTIPQMGEGLQEARLLRFLKQPGDVIKRDEPIFEMETDKATMEIEAPVPGVLIEWLVAEDAIVPIGAVVGRIESHSAVTEATSPQAPSSSKAPEVSAPRGAAAPAARNALLPPRTRAYARECGLDEDELQRIVTSVGRKVLPADVDAWIAGRGAETTAGQAGQYEDVPLSSAQRTLVYRLQQRAGEVISATEEIEVPWEPIDRVRRDLKEMARKAGADVPTPFLLFAWCVVRATIGHPVFRSTYQGNGMIRRHAHLHLGIAVTRDDDELATARVEAADALSFWEFVGAASRAIKRARNGEDQATALMQLSLSNLTGSGVTRAIPVVAAPAVGTIFVGAVHHAPEMRDGQVVLVRRATVTLTFDHRITNGAGAARFLSDIRAAVAGLTTEALGTPAS
ncbi:MAG: hypothetical protein GX446_15460 [Chthonomonadales bacterium]|nr:hypothetical protein [Chthonomonadales bacterium]